MRRGRFQGTSHECHESLNLLSRNRKLLNHLIDTHTRFQILEHNFNRCPGSFENPRAANFARGAFNAWVLRPIKSRHAITLPFIVTSLSAASGCTVQREYLC
jgi:hypothetical protein